MAYKIDAYNMSAFMPKRHTRILSTVLFLPNIKIAASAAILISLGWLILW